MIDVRAALYRGVSNLFTQDGGLRMVPIGYLQVLVEPLSLR